MTTSGDEPHSRSGPHRDSRRRGLLCACALLLGWAAHPALAQDQTAPSNFEFDVPPGTAAEVLSAIAETTGDQILFPYERLRQLDSPGVQGRHSARDALNLALGEADLAAVATDYGVFTVMERPGVQAEAEAEAPARPPRPSEPPPQRLPRPPRPSLLDLEERIIVTGSRITRSGMTTPVPVTVVSRPEIERLSPNTLLDAIDQLPQFVNNSTPVSTVGWSGSAGQSFLNLRGIGSNRTLVLVDGRRMVASTRRGTFDIGLAPEGLVERVEIITGGASAAYGSDAVAGVVNFILDKDFEGFGGHAQAGVSQRGDYEHYEVALSAGISLTPKTHLLLAADRHENGGVPDALDRDWHRSWGLVRNRTTDSPRLLMSPNVVSSAYTYGGLIPRGPLAGTQFLPDGSAAPFDYGTNTSSNSQIGGDGIDVGRERTLSPRTERESAFAYLRHEVTPDISVYAQGIYGRTEADFDKDPSYLASIWEATIYEENPYIPADVRQRMIEAGVESFPFSRYGSRRDLGAGQVNNQNETVSLTLGADGEARGWRFGAYYQYGENRQNLAFSDAVRVDRIYRAMDAVRDPDSGQIVCRSTLSFPDDGCVPTSFFGDGAVSEAAKDWILDENAQVQKLAQHFFEIALDGEIARLPAGMVSAAFGASWRRDNYKQYSTRFDIDDETPSAEEQGYRGLPSYYESGYPLLERAVSENTSGSSEVSEAFGEVVVPLAEDHVLARSLDAHGSVRYANYEGSGPIWAWKTGLDWQLTDSLRLRGTVSRDVRGGTLAERFDFGLGGTTATDPFLEDEPVYSFGATQLGNPEVAPERADTTTVGLIIQPRSIPNFSVSIDYYDVRIRDAISRPGVQAVIDSCFDGMEETCDLILRNDIDGRITRVNTQYLNIERVFTSGVDVELSYFTPVSFLGGNERLDFKGIAAFYTGGTMTPFLQDQRDIVGQTGPGGGLPDYHLLGSATYSRGGASLNLTANYISPGVYNLSYAEGVDVADNTVHGAFYFNSRASYRFGALQGGELEAFLYVRNLFDKDPPIAPAGGGGFYGTFHSPSDFDQIGRRFTAGLAWRF